MTWINSTDLLVNPEEKDPNKRIVFRQVGWLGQSGNFYKMNDTSNYLVKNEPGSFSPIYQQIGPE